MFKNHFKIAIRNLLRHKTYSFINIFGLAMGMAVCLLIFLFVRHELSFDAFHSKAPQIYRLNEVQTFGNVSAQNVALSMALMGETLKEEYAEILDFTRFNTWGKSLYKVGEQELFIPQTVGVDSNFLQFFDFKLLQGDPASALLEPNSIVLTQKQASNFFGVSNPIGQLILNEQDNAFKVTGILEDVPLNSHLQFDALASLTTLTSDTTNQQMRSWGNNFLNTYLLLAPNADIAGLEAQFPDYLVKYMGETVLDYYELYLQPLGEVHLGSTNVTHDYNNFKKFDQKYVYLFILLGFFVLAIASINFMNLSTARSLQRAKEVGVRKTVGASRSQLIRQFLFESVVVALLALLLAVILAKLLIGPVSMVADRAMNLSLYAHPLMLAIVLGITILVGLLSGIVPALVLSAFRPIQAIRQHAAKLTGRKFNPRSAMVVLQFGIAIALIVGTIVVIQQYQHMVKMDTGFDREQVLLLSMNREINEKYETLQERLQASPYVLNVTASSQRLGNNLHQTSCRHESEEGIQGNASSFVNVDYNFIDFYDIELLHGRSFSKAQGTDRNNAYLLNETLAKDLGWEGEKALGKGFSVGGGDELGQVVGVVKDFNYNSLHHKVEPLFLMVRDWGFSEISIRIDARNVSSAIDHIQKEWNTVLSGRPFEYEFLDEHFGQMYQSEKQVSQVVSILALLAILIASLGLFGLATIATEQRTKEIGIRKVLGASMSQLIVLLSKDFTRLVGIAFVLITPLCWWMLNNWLEGFEYRVDISLVVFLVAGLSALLIAWITIGFKSVSAARRNPVEALRWE